MVSVRGQLDAPLLDIGQVEKEYWERKVVHLHSLAKFNKSVHKVGAKCLTNRFV